MNAPGVSDPAPAIPFGVAGVDPAQFRDMWSGTRRSPERDLAVAMLDSAAMDLRAYYRYSHLRSRQRVYWQAYQWVASTNREWPFSFVNICETLDLSPEALAARLLGPRDGAPRRHKQPNTLDRLNRWRRIRCARPASLGGPAAFLRHAESLKTSSG